MSLMLLDAPQRALAFLQNQTLRIEQEVYRVRYADIQYRNLVPVDLTGPEWVPGVTYYSADAVGLAKWFHAKADDVPHAEVLRERFEATISLGAIGYDYDLQEINQALMAGVDLRADKAAAARRAAEEFIDRVAMFGDTSKNMYGIANNPAATSGTAAADGAGSSALWSQKTADLVLRDINAALTGIFTTSYGAEMADTLLIPYQRMLDISFRRIDTVNQTTILEWIRANNVYTMQTGQQLTIRGVWGLDTAGAGSTARLIAYRRAPEILVLYMPMPFQFMPVYQQGPLRFEVPGIFRVSGVEVRRPASVRYVDGI